MGGGKRLVLLGAGHAHLYVLQRARSITALGYAVDIIAPARFWYSGLATGMLGGEVSPTADQVDVAALAAAVGCARVDDEVVGLDPVARRVLLRHGPSLSYDVVSVALGSEVVALPGQGGPSMFSAKPISALWALRRSIETWTGGCLRVVVAGGGMTACEVAANLAALTRSLDKAAQITLIAPPDGVLPGVPQLAARAILAALARSRVALRRDGPVLRLASGCAFVAGGELEFDLLVNATGLVPCAAIGRFGLPLGAQGGLLVDEHLRSVGDARVYGAGDCIDFQSGALPRAGVFAVRQAPVLLHNLISALQGQLAVTFHPQRRYLWIMNLGGGEGVATYGNWSWHGRLPLRLKHAIDRRFLHRLHAVPPQPLD